MCQRLRDARIPRAAIAALVLAGFVLAMFMSASPALHKRLHDDADESQHECLATMLDNGGCEGAPVIQFVAQPMPAPQIVLTAYGGIAPGSFHLSCSIFEHGPPVLS